MAADKGEAFTIWQHKLYQHDSQSLTGCLRLTGSKEDAFSDVVLSASALDLL